MKSQNNIEHILDLVNLGKMTSEEANIELIRSERFKIIYKLPKAIRIQLNNAVKRGELAHKKKDGHKPEIYYHPSFEHLANAERNTIEEKALKNLSAVFICLV